MNIFTLFKRHASITPYSTEQGKQNIKAELARLKDHASSKIAVVERNTERINTLEAQNVELKGIADEANSLADKVSSVVGKL